MKIYIDESGSFSIDKRNKQYSISCVVALVIPEIIENKLFSEFKVWKDKILLKYKISKNEIKGSKLDESDFRSLLSILAQFDILLEVDAIDLGLTADPEIEAHKADMAKSHARSNTGNNTNIRFKRDITASLSNPNYVQALSTSSLVYKVLDIAINYYAQRSPQELSKIQWICDEKGVDYENILTAIVMPLVQTDCLEKPIANVEGFDYSCFKEYILGDECSILEPLKSKSQKPSDFLNITAIMSDIKFMQSHNDVGVQIVDILASCAGRAMRGNLKFEGWKYLSSLIVKRPGGAISITSFEEKAKTAVKVRTSLANFVNYFKDHGKEMVVPENLLGRIKPDKGYVRWSYLDEIPMHTPSKKTTYEYY